MSESEDHVDLGTGWPPWKEGPSEKPQRRSHPIRLAFMMLMGALLGFALCTPMVGNTLDPWMRWRPFVYIASGAMFGLGAELFIRSNEASWRRVTVAVSIILGTVILIAAALSVADHE